MAATKSGNKKIIIYDGHCPLCNKAVSFTQIADKLFKFKYINRFDDESKKYNAMEIDSIILVENDVVYFKSQAIIKIFSELGYPYKLLNIFKVVPYSWLNVVYDYISRNRNQWFHSESTCKVKS